MSNTTPFIPGPTGDTIDLEQVGPKGAVNLDTDNEPAFALRRGQLVRLTVLGVIEGAQEGARRSADTTLTFRKWIVNATDLESMELVEQPEASAAKDGQIPGQLDLRDSAVVDDAGAPAGVSEAEAKATRPDAGKQPVLFTLPNGETIERGSRWIHGTTSRVYRCMAKGKSGDDNMIFVADVDTDAEDAFPVQSFGESLVAEAALPPAAKPKKRGKRAPATAEEEDARALEIAAQMTPAVGGDPPPSSEDLAAGFPDLDPAGAPLGHPEDVKAALGDGA